jgi:hypothetical protein
MRGAAQGLVVGVLTFALLAPAAAEEPAPPADVASPPAAAAASPEAAPAPQRVEMVPANERLVITYRWPRWIPWTVFGSGVALGALGFLLEYDATNLMNEYDQRIASQCAVNGCNLSDPQTPSEQALADDLNNQRETAERRQKIGFGTLLVAGAGLATGIVLLVLNRPQAHVLKMDLVPADGGATATVGWRF